VLVLIGRIPPHPLWDSPVGEFDSALVPEARLLSDKLADEERALVEHVQERRAIRKAIRITEQTKAPGLLFDRDHARLREERDPGVGAIRDIPHASSWTGHVPIQHHRQSTLAKDRVPRRPVVVTDDVVSRRCDESPSRLGRGLETFD